jgi:hypothetical protein
MTPDHKFELMRTALSIVPATLLSAWALIHQRRQTQARLDVLLSPIFVPTVDGKSILGEDWPGVVVRNQSGFSLRVSNVGYFIGEKFYTFDKPFGTNFNLVEEWPADVAPRTRKVFFPSPVAQATLRSLVLPQLNGKKIWEIGRAYAITECSHTFFSRRLSRKSLKMLREAQPPAKNESAVNISS